MTKATQLVGGDLSVEAVRGKDLGDGHLVLGQSSCLVGADHIAAA